MIVTNNYGAMIHMVAVPDNRHWHYRVVGERLTNCGMEFPLFVRSEEDIPAENIARGDTICDRCTNTISVIRRYHVEADD